MKTRFQATLFRAVLTGVAAAGIAASRAEPPPPGPPGAAAPDPKPTHRAQGLALYDLPKYADGFAHFDYVNPDAPKGGTLRLAAEGGFDSLNMFIPKGTAIALDAYVYETLAVSSLDEPFTMYGLLAETMEMPEDRSSITFHLRPEARWSDGLPVTPEDVVFSFTNLVTRGWPYYRMYYRSVKGVEKTGPHSVRFTLDTSETNRELPLICGQLPILPRHDWATNDFTVPTLRPVVGSGPYRIRSVDPNRRIVFERDPNYWGRAVNVNAGMNNFDLVQIDFYRDSVVKREAFKSGAFDWMLVNSAKEWATEYEIPAVREGLIRREVLPNERLAWMQGIAFNLRRPLFRDRRVRQALGYAFDFEWANSALMHDAYTRCRSYFGNTDLEAKGVPEGRELEILKDLQSRFPDQVPPEVFTAEYHPPSIDSSHGTDARRMAVRRNLLEARRLLAEAGWYIRAGDRKLVNDDERDAQGRHRPFEFEILLVSPTFERVILPFRLSLRRLGIECRVRTVDTSVYQNRMLEFDFDMTINSWRMSESPGNEQRDYWHSSQAEIVGSLNLCGIRSPAIDDVVNQLIAAPTRAELEARTRALDRLLQWGFYCVPNWYFSGDRVVYWDKFGHPPEAPSKGTTLGLWWIDPGRERTLPERRSRLRKR